jgi:pimeloyl-ACP methyl ester carboxylesterase
MAYDETFRTADGRVLSYLDAGDPEGTPVIFCHGSPSSRLAATDLASAVAERGGRLIAIDRPGLGRSEPEVGRSLASYAADVAELANALGLARFRLLSVSGGGPYALATAWALPDRVERVALLSSPGSFDIPGAMDGMVWIQRLMWLLARWQPRMLRWLLRQQRDAAVKDPDQFTQRIVEGMRGADREAVEALDAGARRRFIADPLIEGLRQDPRFS